MVVKEIVIKNPSGLQSKAAAVFIQKASGYKSSIWVFKGDKKANGKSLLGILSLEIGKGDKIKLSVEGEDEAEVAAELEEYLVTDTGDIG
ncbi:MAG: HPr family phosphocarrier protein [Bacillota bacterium]